MRDDRALKLLGHAAGALEGAVGDEDGACTLLDEMAGGKFAHFACADEEDGAALERAEDLARHFNGDRSDGDGVGADLGFGAGVFGGGKGALQQMFELAGDGAGGAGDGEGLFDLAENLRLADDHGVEAGGHAEEMADGLLVAVLVEMRNQDFGFESEVVGEKAVKSECPATSTAASNSTRLQVETIMHSVTPGTAARARVVSGRSSREMAMRSRSAMGAVLWFTPMRARRHWGPNLCTRLKRLATQTAIMTTRTAPET